MDTQIPRLELRTGRLGDLPDSKLDELLRKTPPVLFESLGLVVPVAQRIYDETLKPGTGVLDWNGRTLETLDLHAEVTALDLAVLMEHSAAELLLPAQVEYYLTKLKTQAPALAGAVNARIPVEALMRELRSRLEQRRSIRNFAGILEEMLAASIEGAGPGPLTPPRTM